LYNAAYFAGMTDVTHKPHSFYIGRYPPGREATVFEGAIDMKFRNDLPTGVMIQTAWTPTSLTVRLYGTKKFEVTSSTGPRTNPTEPTKVEIPSGQPCAASQGAPGFTVTDTRTLRDVKTGQVKSERRTTKYNPSPIVTCGSERRRKGSSGRALGLPDSASGHLAFDHHQWRGLRGSEC
jgi:vancomycin resistance protein YoaR